jgi:hypothetical protein
MSATRKRFSAAIWPVSAWRASQVEPCPPRPSVRSSRQGPACGEAAVAVAVSVAVGSTVWVVVDKATGT